VPPFDKESDADHAAVVSDLLRIYSTQLPLISDASERLRTLIQHAVEEARVKVSSISVRVKRNDSLKRKLERKRKYASLTDVTDLIGLRIITYDPDDSDRVSRAIRDSFDCDWDNCEDKSDRLKAEQFGYRSDHHVIYVPKCILENVPGLRAEIQVRTLLQHAWAEIEHDDLGYHADSLVPTEIRRRLARVAAVLEGVDLEFRDLRKIAQRPALRSIRVEGLSEPLGEVEFSLDPKTLRTIQDSDLTLFFNTNVTPTPGSEKDPLLIVEDAALSKPVRGELIAANAIRFRDAVPKYITDQLRHVRCRLRGIRVNANQLGISVRPIPTHIVCAVGVIRNENVTSRPELLNQQVIAEVRVGLLAECFVADSLSNDDYAAVTIEFEEGFPGSFKCSQQETAGDRLAKRGTRLMARFDGLAPDAVLWVSTKNLPQPDSHRLAATASLIEADVNGGGPGLIRELVNPAVPACLNETTAILPAHGAGQTRWAVWEMDQNTIPSLCSRRLSFRAFLPKKFWPISGLICRLHLAPLGTSTTPVDSPVPRFADVSITRRLELRQP
jgi:ppGpp synthetase/RelA/SpoT-type nucleotidyltranferase